MRLNPRAFYCKIKRKDKEAIAMKMMIGSDLHGSAYYTEKLIEAYQREKAGKLLLLGDILYHGPRNDLPRDYAPKEVIPMLNNLRQDILCVRGNCDTEVDQMVLEFPIMADYCILYLGERMIFATHGHRKENLPMLKKGDILLCGHTHVTALKEEKDYVYMNPGSVSIPKENTQRGYITLEEGLFIWKNLDGTEIMNYQAK